MKAILISKPPKQVANILNGKQSIIINKTAPKDWVDYLSGKTNIKPKPMTAYIHSTRDGALYIIRDFFKEAVLYGTDLSKKCFKAVYGELKHKKPCKYDMSGHVVAKFTLREVERIEDPDYAIYESIQIILRQACMDEESLEEYAHDKQSYAWHISDLQILDEPKTIWRMNFFSKPKKVRQIGHYDMLESKQISKAPQSWCYIETEESKK